MEILWIFLSKKALHKTALFYSCGHEYPYHYCYHWMRSEFIVATDIFINLVCAKMYAQK